MKTTALLATLATLLMPGIAAAACSGHQDTAQISCAQGTVYDAEAEACVPQTS